MSNDLLEGLTGSELATGTGTGQRLADDRCKIDTLENKGILLGNHRDDDRLRLIKYSVNHPEGAPIAQCWRDVFGRTGPVDPADSDYQLTRRFYTGNDEYFDTFEQNGQTSVEYRLSLLDLIREGITQKSDFDYADDRQYWRSSLARTSSLGDDHKEGLAEALQSYVNRIDDYRMLFRATDLRSGDDQLFTKPYLTRFNSMGRIKQQWARFNAALDHARDNFENAAVVTLTTDPKKFPHLLAAWEDINPNFNRLMSWMDYEPKQKPSSRPGYRPPYIKAVEATQDGKPHLHVLFFDVPTRNGKPHLIDKQELSNRWDDLGQGKIVDLQGLQYRGDLDEAYSVDEGFVSVEEATRLDRGDPPICPDGGAAEGVGAGQTAGQYLGKYLSAMFGGVMQMATAGNFDVAGAYAEKAATYKLALYWATDRKMWSISKDIEESIDLDDGGADILDDLE